MIQLLKFRILSLQRVRRQNPFRARQPEYCQEVCTEPEQFPGLIHRMLDPKTVILLFASGKLVCTGAKKETEVYRAVTNLHTLLEEKNLMIYES